jgi:inner membrane protein
MASVFGHSALALALGRYRFYGGRSWKFWLFMLLCSVLPDADVAAFYFGIPYGDPLGHRGFSHSILFAVLLGFVISFLFFKRSIPKFPHELANPVLPTGRKLFSREQFVVAVFLSASTLSHGLLDAMTNGGMGVGFFIPFDNSRYFFPFRPIEVSPISIQAFFEGRGWGVLKSEAVWIGRIIFALLFLQFLAERFRRARR